MKELDFICKFINDDIANDGTISNEDKHYIKGKITAARFKLEDELLHFKRNVCHECKESLCKKQEEHVLHCISIN